jgi:hypothetical protein
VSEATRGVLNTLELLGLRKEVRARDLTAIRQWFTQQQPDSYTERVFAQAGVKYCVMTNVPFDAAEVPHWRPTVRPYSSRFRSALRVDPLLKGDWDAVQKAVTKEGYPPTLDGVRTYVKAWADTMKPE